MNCFKACPANKIYTLNDLISPSNAFAAWLIEDKSRLLSSSGGIFTALSSIIMQKGGSVCGALYKEDMTVHHTITKDKKIRDLMRGSKYVQSNLGRSYSIIKELLENNEIVLFTGTPCQVAGLYTYLGREHEHLYTADVICGSVTSPEIFKDYINLIEKQSQDNVIDYKFRNKKRGWSKNTLVVYFKNRKPKIINPKIDLYYGIFSRRLASRPCCYNCRFAKLERESDLTLADFWGVKKVYPQFYSEKGVSLVLTNTAKGCKLFSMANEVIIKNKVSLQASAIYQKRLFEPISKNLNRTDFFSTVGKYGFYLAAIRYVTIERLLSILHFNL
jgi:hypothetical protein